MVIRLPGSKDTQSAGAVPPDARALGAQVREKKALLDQMKGQIRPGALDNLEQVHRIDVTYTSNALEGNTLTAGETALVIEKGITVGGKPLRDHLEAIDHAAALDWIYEIASQNKAALTEADIRGLHHLVVARSKPEIAGRYADCARYIITDAGKYHFPGHWEVPALMREFCAWLDAMPELPESAFEAHRRLVTIHPFNDGNGRVSRLLMNLMLIQGGYPPIAIRPEDRRAYHAALELAQAGGSTEGFDRLMLMRLDQSLDSFLQAAQEACVCLEQEDAPAPPVLAGPGPS